MPKYKKIILLLGLLLLIFAAYKFFSPKISSPQKPTEETTSQVLAQVAVNRSFTFPAQIQGGKKTEDVTFTITTVERKNEIKVKSKPRQALPGNNFLLVRLELDNPSTERLIFASADFIRLLGKDDKKFSPDFHNGQVIIDPLSVRRDLVSFMAAQDQKNFTLLVGELEKDKERLEINFP